MNAKILEIDHRHVWHPYTPDPHLGPKTVWKKAQGSFVYDHSGKPYFDTTSSWWCVLHGHCHPRLVNAVCEQASQMDQVMFAPHTHEEAALYAEELCFVMGEPFQKVFYSDDGSTAVEVALKMSLQYWANVGKPHKSRFLSVHEGYHGDTLGAVSVGYLEGFHHFFKHVIRQPYKSVQPYCYRCPLSLEYPSCELACQSKVLETLEKEHENIAALIVEPLVMGAAGMVIYPREFLVNLMNKAKEYDVHVIFDEVFTGFGRTGELFAYEHIEQKPDIVCLSKGVTGGMLPLGVTVTHDRIYEAFKGGADKEFYHGHTFTANPISVAVARESLGLLRQEWRGYQCKQSWFGSQVEKFRQIPCVGDVRHLGMIWALELVGKNQERLSSEVMWGVAEKLWLDGVWTRPLDNILYLVPPLSVTREEIQVVFEAYERVLLGVL